MRMLCSLIGRYSFLRLTSASSYTRTCVTVSRGGKKGRKTNKLQLCMDAALFSCKYLLPFQVPINGCNVMIQIFVQLWYLDNLNHMVCPPERFRNPRFKFWTKEISAADRVGSGEYGRLDVSTLNYILH